MVMISEAFIDSDHCAFSRNWLPYFVVIINDSIGAVVRIVYDPKTPPEIQEDTLVEQRFIGFGTHQLSNQAAP